jgi:hypothetical protein
VDSVLLQHYFGGLITAAMRSPIFNFTSSALRRVITLSMRFSPTRTTTTPLTLTVADLKKMPRKTLSVANPPSQKTEVYEGVLLEHLLRRAGATQGEQLRGPAMASYLGDGTAWFFPWRNWTQESWIQKYSSPIPWTALR